MFVSLNPSTLAVCGERRQTSDIPERLQDEGALQSEICKKEIWGLFPEVPKQHLVRKLRQQCNFNWNFNCINEITSLLRKSNYYRLQRISSI